MNNRIVDRDKKYKANLQNVKSWEDRAWNVGVEADAPKTTMAKAVVKSDKKRQCERCGVPVTRRYCKPCSYDVRLEAERRQ